MVATRLELNMTRLLSRCEEKVKEKKLGDWRLEKYIRALMEMFEELKKSPTCPSKEELNSYVKKIEFLKGLIEAERLPNAAEKMLAAEKLTPASTSNDPDPVSGKKLCHLTKGRYEKEMREDLFGGSSNDEKTKGTDLRHRKVSNDKTDINAILQHHNEMQEKLADEMLMLTRNLKTNVTAAKRIVSDDLKILSDSSQLAGTNMDRLKVETERLEAHTNSCTWWVWLMIVAVTCTFLWMIIFIRIFHK